MDLERRLQIKVIEEKGRYQDQLNKMHLTFNEEKDSLLIQLVRLSISFLKTIQLFI